MQLRIINETRHQALAETARKADRWLDRLRGLLFSGPLETNQGLLIVPCNAIHCIGMTYPIDAIFIDKKLMVVGLVENLKPWRLSPLYAAAHSCLELPAGIISQSGTQVGDQLLMQELQCSH